MAAADITAPKVQPYRTNLNVCLMGLIVFLVSELALFGAFFMYYANLRLARGVPWPGDFDIPFESTSINTLILVVSSFTCEFALLSLDKKGKGGAVFAWLFATFVLGAIFLGLQVHEYMTVGFTPQTTSVGAIFFCLTGLHGLHVFVGLLLLVLGMVRAIRGRWTKDSHVGLLGISVYWHFVDIVWVLLFTVVYCLPSS
ncbi:MAG: cytochrome c oxidase subunit 3 [Gaiellales bacterium]